MYKTITVNSLGGDKVAIIRDNGNGNFSSFLENPDNPDYQAYLKWLEAGNTPEPADVQGEQA